MPITSPVAIRFVNEKVRPIADMITQLDNFALLTERYWCMPAALS